ncbi:DeoR/GlpR transcriptional regulator [Alicyclobacillaceae bacterium I2511]|nr:DeoR/GlpR transcriptional regulator [Alicyclobacillaceae bacterium I2511]
MGIKNVIVYGVFSMLSVERQDLIRDIILKQRLVKVTELTNLFSVSEMTIRRDLDVLEKKGVLKKVYGGAVAERSMYEEIGDIPLQVRSVDRILEKRLIAQKAIQFIQPNDVIILDAGTTTLEIARLIRQRSDLVVITNSILAASDLAGSSVSLLMMGGQIRGTSHSTVGAKTNEFLSDLSVSTLFLAASGLSLDKGIMNSNLDESEVKRTMMKHSEKTVLVADPSKFQHESFHVFAAWDEIDVFITTSLLPKSYLEELEALNVQVVIAEAPSDLENGKVSTTSVSDGEEG